MLQTIITKIQRSRFLSRVNLFLRNFRSKRKVTSQNSLIKNGIGFHFNFRTILVLLLIVVFFGFVFFNLYKYITLAINAYSPEEVVNRKQMNSDFKGINILLVGLDDTQNSFKFVNMLAVFSLDYQTGIPRIYGLNPNYIVNYNGQNITIRTLYNFINEGDEERITAISEVVEDAYAIRLDRYMAFTYSDLKNLVNSLDLNLQLDKSYKINETFLAEGSLIQGEDLYNFVTYNEFPDDEAIINQIRFLTRLFESLRDSFSLYRMFLNHENITNNFTTNFSKDEFVRFLMTLDSTELTILSKISSQDLTLRDLTTISLEEGIVFSDMLVDENTSSMFRSIPIVKEQAKVEVFNGTDTAGLANKVKRKLENVGITVIKTGNYPDNKEKTTLYIPKSNPQEFENTISFIKTLYGDQLEIVIGEYKFNYSGDMILVIGNN